MLLIIIARFIQINYCYIHLLLQMDELDGFESNEEQQIQLIQQQKNNQNNPFTSYLCKLPSPLQISENKYSLAPDLVTGWMPKRNITCPVPLKFQSEITDFIIKQLSNQQKKQQYKIIYTGYRPHNTYEMHSAFSPNNYHFQHLYLEKQNTSQMQNFFKYFYANFQRSKNSGFQGMNPQIDSDLTFDSKFQSGNLDCAILVAQKQYDLFIRSDSNTTGHKLWYYFRVMNKKKQKYKFNICNIKSTMTLYNDGFMHPYFYSKKSDQNKIIRWEQLPSSICGDKPLRYQFLKKKFSKLDISTFNISFQYEFQYEQDVVQFAFCIPYTFSRVIKVIKQIKTEIIIKKYNHLKITKLGETLSGIEIPMLTFGTQNQTNKKVILMTARIHPGESNGSWVMEQIMKQLAEYSKYEQLFERAIFKIVPMVNPDGVILGNFRTSSAGKDLNRCFFREKTLLFPEISALKKLVAKLKQQYNNKLFLFLDLHGHSSRKNVFLYGMDRLGSLEGRIFPKIFASKTPMFRYYSCCFKLKNDKKTTGRACFLKYFKQCWTIESSVSCYFTKDNPYIPFNEIKWLQVGYYLIESLKQYESLILSKQIRNSKYLTRKKLMTNKRKVQLSRLNLQLNKFFNSTIQKKTEVETPFEKYLQIFNTVKNDDNKFEDGVETDSQGEDYPLQNLQEFQKQLCTAKNLFQKAYKHQKIQRVQYNSQKKYNKDHNNNYSHISRRQLVSRKTKVRKYSDSNYSKPLIQKDKQQSEVSQIHSKRQSENYKKSYTENKVQLKTRVATVGSQYLKFNYNHIFGNPYQNFNLYVQQRIKKRQHTEEGVELNAQREISPLSKPKSNLFSHENYIKPLGIKSKKGYVGKKQLMKRVASFVWGVQTQSDFLC